MEKIIRSKVEEHVAGIKDGLIKRKTNLVHKEDIIKADITN